MENYKYTIAYIIGILSVNYGFSLVPPVPILGEMWPPMSLAVGLIFVLRDFAQREIGHRVIGAMLIGALLSYYLADPFVAVASVVAFLISETADWIVYTVSKRPLHQRIVISSAVGTPLDSAVFLAMIGYFSIGGVVLMTLSKMIGAFVVMYLVRRRNNEASV
jgi:uncharacterized PurR-regulated membrane protein YhhQ (DUF165 family)